MLHRDGITFNPHLPENLQRIKFKLRYKGHWMSLDLNKKKICLKSQPGRAEILNIFINGEKYALKPGEKIETNYQ